MNTTTTVMPRSNNFDHFWAEIAPIEHIVQLYTSSDRFIESLERFVGNGIQQGEGVIVIATGAHICALNQRLTMRGFNIEAAILQHQYIPLDAEEILAKFIMNKWPDEKLFEQLITGLLTNAGNNRKRVRAFGEMVAILWANGHVEAIHQLEQLWDKLCQKKFVSLFCDYPKSGFTQNTEASILEICKTHSKVI
jgi:hypothetical protein